MVTKLKLKGSSTAQPAQQALAEPAQSTGLDFTIRTTTGKFRNLMDAAKVLIADVYIKLSPQGLRIRALDPAYIGNLNINLPADSDFFEEFVCPAETMILLNAERVLNTLQPFAPETKLEVWKATDESGIHFDTLQIDVVENKQHKTKTSEWVLNPSETEAALNPWDKTPNPFDPPAVKAVFASKDLVKTVESHQAIAGVARIIVTPKDVTVATKSDVGSGKTVFRAIGDARVRNFQVLREFTTAETIYTTAFLASLLSKTQPFGEWVMLELGNDIPLKATYILSKETIEVSISPRITEE
jgi:hypothetical protein